MFGISVPTLATWAREGALPYVPTPGGHRRYRRVDVRALLEKKNTAEPARTEMEEDAVRLYEQGWSIRQVAERFECGYGAMRRILARHGVLRSKKQAADGREGPSLGTFSTEPPPPRGLQAEEAGERKRDPREGQSAVRRRRARWRQVGPQ